MSEQAPTKDPDKDNADSPLCEGCGQPLDEHAVRVQVTNDTGHIRFGWLCRSCFLAPSS
jgi:hypothetical protein